MARPLDRQRKLERKAKKAAKRRDRERQIARQYSAQWRFEDNDEFADSTQLEVAIPTITTEPLVQLPPHIEALMDEANEAIQRGEGEEAKRLLDEALRLHPNEVALQFNRAVAIRQQGFVEEALEIIQQIHHDYPDHVLARTHLADDCINEDDIEGAQQLLAPIGARKQMHANEFGAYCSANINLALAMDDRATARAYLRAWEKAVPDDCRILIWQIRVELVGNTFHQLRRLVRELPFDGERND